MRFCFFLDALDERDLEVAPFLKQYAKGYTPNVPRVTPNIISQIMTGKSREETGFLLTTFYKEKRKTDLTGKTILHYATDNDLKVLQYGIPLCANIKLPEGSLTTFDHFLRQQNVPPQLNFVRARGDVTKDDPDNMLNGVIDETVAQFATLRNVCRNNKFDVIFWGYQPLDAYAHNYDRERRLDLLRVLDAEIHQVHKDLKAEILFFSDHGSEKKIKEFHINQWLRDKGWFEYELAMLQYNQHRNEKAKMDIITINSPYTYINWDNTKFYCSDSFDCVITKTDKATDEDVQLMIAGLKQTDCFNNVEVVGDYIVPETAKGIETTSNLHPNADKKPDNIRTGWHSPYAVYGCTDTEYPVKEPKDIYTLMTKFIDKEEPTKEEPKEEEVMVENLVAMGYI